jgi:hypothetical protein
MIKFNLHFREVLKPAYIDLETGLGCFSVNSPELTNFRCQHLCSGQVMAQTGVGGESQLTCVMTKASVPKS